MLNSNTTPASAPRRSEFPNLIISPERDPTVPKQTITTDWKRWWGAKLAPPRNFHAFRHVSLVSNRIQHRYYGAQQEGRTTMEGLTGLAAVIMFLGMPTAILA